ncbi:GIY-YIG nuclease family protein [Treponema primitia]
MSYGIIYKATGPTGKVYIGQTTRKLQDRINGHKCDALTHNAGGRFYYAIRKYGLDAFSWEQIDTANDHEDLQQKEIYWIAFYKSNNANHGYNLTAGGGQPVVNKEVGKIRGEKRKGQKHTPEALQKMREAKNKHWADPEYRKHMVEVHKGKILPPEQRKKMGDSRKGHIVTEETRRKIGEANKGNKPWIYGLGHSEETKQKLHEKNKGDKIWSVKITEETARQIKSDIAEGMRNCDIARKYGVRVSIVENIKYGLAWKWVA